MGPQQLEARYRQLLAAYQKGSLSQEQFSLACQELLFQDDQSIWWAIDPGTGGWLRYDPGSGAWQAAALPPRTPDRRPSLIDASSTTGPSASNIESVSQFFESNPSGIIQGIAVFVLSAAISLIGWIPFSWPPRLFTTLVPPGNCSNYRVGSLAMYLCSAKIAVFILIVPLLTALLIFLLRRRLAALTARLIPHLPSAMHFLVAPSLATLFFVIVWAGAHYQTGGGSGILPQKLFPALIGLFTFITKRYGPGLQRALAGFFVSRDKVPKFLRFLAVLLVPTLLSLVITYQDRVSATATKEQVVVLVGLTMGYLMLAPHSGDLLAGIKGMMAGKGRQP
ncbi:MAG: hypothetical protein PHW74_01625 [Desulfobacca sp.]|nr:hypothetical protein [Desulfobacca sp.]